MCTREEVKLEVEAGERRMESRLQFSHRAIDLTISNFMGEMKDDFKELKKKADESIIDRNKIHSLLESSKEVQEKILEQTIRTNGRVTGLETWKAAHEVENKNLTENLDDVRKILARINWMVITAVVVGLLSIVFK
jgi:septal ring factor EnvC (AmiA/AmiB activator)